MNARYESRDNNIARASMRVCVHARVPQVPRCARGHVVKYSRALMPARALCEGACYRDYIFCVRGERRNCPDFVFYDVRETLCLAATAKRLSSVAVAALPPRIRRSAAVVAVVRGEGEFSARGEGVKIYATPKWKGARALNYSSLRNIGYATSAFGETNATDALRNRVLRMRSTVVDCVRC